MEIPVIRGIRILTEERIKMLNDNDFRRYRRKALDTRDFVHSECGSEAEIKALDYLANAVNRENDSRETKKLDEWLALPLYEKYKHR